MKRTYYFLPLLILTLAGCKKDKTVALPGVALLTFPANNAACITGTIINDSTSTVTFTWNTSDNTNGYQLTVKNLLTSKIAIVSTATNTLSVTLSRNTPYSWNVVSQNTAGVTQSDTWKFYNAGLAVISYPPFPADGLMPAFGQNVSAINGTINLSWVGSDPDKDIAGYDIYFGTNTTPVLYKGNITDMFLNNVLVTSGTIYYWKVITKDKQGNTSDSGIFQFKVN